MALGEQEKWELQGVHGMNVLEAWRELVGVMSSICVQFSPAAVGPPETWAIVKMP